MPNRFQKHYTRDQARNLLPKVRVWLKQLLNFRDKVQEQEKRLTKLMAPGRDVGGDLVNAWVRTLAAMQEVLLEFYRREILIKDLDRGLIDFPSLQQGKEVFLCWEQGEPDVEFWHDLDAGYAGRERLEDD